MLQGLIVGDFIARETSTFQKMVKFNLAVQEEYKKKGSDKKGYETFSCTAFGAIADVICGCCQNGSRVVVVGKLKKTTYLDKSLGGKTTGVVVNVESVYFAGYPKRQRENKDYAPTSEYELKEISYRDSKISVDDLAFEHSNINKLMKSIEKDPNMLGGFSSGEDWKPIN